MEPLPHRVRREQFRVRAGSQTEALELRARLRTQLERELMPALERAFDASDPQLGIVHVPRLELRIEIADASGIDAAFGAALERETTRALREAIAGLAPQGLGGEGAPRAAAAENGELASPAPPAAQPLPQMLRDALLAWLARGELPWALRGGFWGEPELRELAATHTGEAPQRLLAALHELLGAPPTAAVFRRWLQLLSPEQWTPLGAALFPAAHLPDEIEPLLGAWRRRALSQLATLHAVAFGFAVAASRPGGSGDWLRAAARELEPLISATEAQTLRELADEGSLEIQAPHVVAEGAQPARAASGPPLVATAPPQAAPAARDAAGGAASTDAHREEGVLEASAAIPARHAGLVLLAPYLAHLFEAAGLWRGGEQQLTPAAQARAVALLAYAATGREDEIAIDFGLIHLLVGLPLTAESTLAAGLLSVAARDEVNALLGAVVAHWRALGRTTPDGLRSSFLQRGGWLRAREDGWQLSLESAGVDVLLARLPWSFSRTRLPWMARAVFTDWEPA